MTLFEFSWFVPLLISLTIWDIAWKIIAMWRASQNNQKGWFIALALINSFGVLPIFFIFAIQKKR